MKLRKLKVSKFLFLTITCVLIATVSLGIVDILIDYRVLKFSIYYNLFLVFFFIELIFYSLALYHFLRKSNKFLEFYRLGISFTLLYLSYHFFKEIYFENSYFNNGSISYKIGNVLGFIIIFFLFVYSIFYFKKKINFDLNDEIERIGENN